MAKINGTNSQSRKTGRSVETTVLDRFPKVRKLSSKHIEAYKAVIVVLAHPKYGRF